MNTNVYHPGLEGVIAGQTAICTIIDGLRYRGYPIEDLVKQATFEEVAYLLLYGDLPNRRELEQFQQRLVNARKVHPTVLEILRRIPSTVPLMDVLRTAISLLGHFDPDAGVNNHAANLRKAERLIACIPTLIVACQSLKIEKEPPVSTRHLSHAANFLSMLSGHTPSAEDARALDVSFMLYAEHELNASTFACRVAASTLTDIFSAVTAGICTLKGPLHGGANEAAAEMLLSFSNPQEAEAWVRQALAKKERIMGFGHRVYKQVDPRAEIARAHCQAMALRRGDLSLEETARAVEAVVKAERGLPANLDWPVARLYFYLNLGTELYTPLFVASRVCGWCAHVVEQLENNHIYRPLSRYVGPGPRKVIPLEQRG